MRRIWFVVAMVVSLAGGAQAQVQLNVRNCADNSSSRNWSAHFNITVPDWRPLVPAGAIEELLEKAASEALAYCARTNPNVRPLDFFAYVMQGSNQLVHGRKYHGRTAWELYNNDVPGKQRALEAQIDAQKKAAAAQAAASAALSEAAEKAKAIRDKFVSDFRVETFASQSGLKANPFPYKDKVVGVAARFVQMVGDGEAIFGDLLVQRVPNTAFTEEGTIALLAIRVNGLKNVKSPVGGEIAVPYGTYVGSYKCSITNCSDFFGPRTQ
ncbi:MAG: hypothetical protein QOH67_737 [Hyphomicrobiales bacterium]|jgi:hypothetical protein|nr:hypothetical protein [Hyphomicrobiales bacterium]